MNLDLVNKLTKPDRSLAAGGQSVSVGEFSGKTLIRAACLRVFPSRLPKWNWRPQGVAMGAGNRYPGNMDSVQ